MKKEQKNPTKKQWACLAGTGLLLSTALVLTRCHGDRLSKNLENLERERIEIEERGKKELNDLEKKLKEKYFIEESTPKEQNFPKPAYTNEDKTLLARMIFGEARGYSDEVKTAIAHTAFNRQKDKRWSSELKKVILQPKQYSCFNKKDANSKKVWNPNLCNPIEWYRCKTSVTKIIKSEDPTDGANHYHMGYVSPYWSKGKKPVAVFKEKGKTFYFYRL